MKGSAVGKKTSPLRVKRQLSRQEVAVLCVIGSHHLLKLAHGPQDCIPGCGSTFDMAAFVLRGEEVGDEWRCLAHGLCLLRIFAAAPNKGITSPIRLVGGIDNTRLTTHSSPRTQHSGSYRPSFSCFSRFLIAPHRTLQRLAPQTSIMDPDTPTTPVPQPSVWRWILGFLMVGACWGLTTPLMRRAALNYTPPARPSLTDPNNSGLKRKALGIWYAVIGTLSRPAYAVPFLLNVTGSIWFFILIGQAGKPRGERGQVKVEDADDDRIEPCRPDHELFSVHVHSTGRMVGGEEDHQQRYDQAP